MYRTCAFCNGKLDGDGGPTDLGVGRRLAFDEWKGRLWVICPRCSRWNLAPLDDRLERIEALVRTAADGRVAAATDHVALIRWHGYDLVRVGKPRRLELATWRYGERLRARRQEQLKFVVPMTVAAVGLAVAVNVAAGGSVGVFVWNTPRLVKRIYLEMVGRRKIAFVEPPICERCGSVMPLRARHPERARGGRQRAEDAARLVEGAGGPHQLIHDVARRELTLRSLAPDRRLALEMAVDERAEVEELERQWQEAEEIADIADGMLSADQGIDEELRRLRERLDKRKER